MTLTTEAGMTSAWKDYALHLRKILEMCGAEPPQCLPGEPDDCGNDFAHHCVGYLAMLKAKADDGLEHIHHGDPAGQQMADDLYEVWRENFRTTGDCSRCG